MYIAVILLCVVPCWNIDPPEVACFTDRDLSQTTYIGMNTENATLESLIAAAQNYSGDRIPLNITPLNDWAPVQSRPVGVGGIVMDENELAVTDGGSISSESQSEESETMSSCDIQIISVLVITALLFMISQASSCRSQTIRRTHR